LEAIFSDGNDLIFIALDRVGDCCARVDADAT
jgi:hypothetical protein